MIEMFHFVISISICLVVKKDTTVPIEIKFTTKGEGGGRECDQNIKLVFKGL